MNKLEWINYSSTLYTAQLQLYKNANSPHDVVLVSSDGEYFISHKIVLSSSSEFFHNILIDVPTEITPTIHLPDVDSFLVECLLSFVYKGESCVKSSYLTKVLDMCQFLQIKGFISHDYSVNGMKLDTNTYLPSELADDGNRNDELSADSSESTKNVYMSCTQSEDDFTVEYLDCADLDENFSDEAERDVELEPENNDNMSHLAIETGDSVNYNQITEPKQGSKRKSSSYGQISRSDFDMALSELPKGKTIHQLSIEYNLPRSTLYQKFRSNESLKQNYRSERRFALGQAVRCVMEERLSLKKASDRYNLPKTAIWRELRKYHHYQPPSKAISQERQNAQNEILSGKSLTSISNKFNIPLTTLHRDKKRLSSEGKLPEFLRVRDRTENSDYGKRLEQALQNCRQGMSQYQAARIFNIPKATMWRYAHALFKAENKDELESD